MCFLVLLFGFSHTIFSGHWELVWKLGKYMLCIHRQEEQSLRKFYNIKCICGIHTHNSPKQQDSGNKKDVCNVRLQITGFVHCCQRCCGPGTMKVMFFFLFIPFVWFWRFRGLNHRHHASEADTVLLWPQLVLVFGDKVLLFPRLDFNMWFFCFPPRS